VGIIDSIVNLPPTAAGNQAPVLSCPEGKIVLNAGYEVLFGAPTVLSSHPFGVTSWAFSLRGGSTGATMRLSVTCADVAATA
jgi:hypothetical protein